MPYYPSNELDPSVLKDSDIGISVQGYNPNTVIDSGYVHTDNNYTNADKSKVDTAVQPADITDVVRDSDIGVTVQAYDVDLTSWAGISPSSKQNTLVSGTSIKTVNNTSLLGSGDLTLFSGGLTQVVIVSTLPGTPNPNTLYIVTG